MKETKILLEVTVHTKEIVLFAISRSQTKA